MHRILVDEKRWVGEARFLHALNFCMLLPGPEAQQLAIYLGWLLHRTCGRAGRRRAVRAAGLPRDPRAQRRLRDLGRDDAARGRLLRAQGGGARHRGAGGRAASARRALQQPRQRRARGRGLRRDLLLRPALPADRARRRPRRLDRRRGAARQPSAPAATAAGRPGLDDADSALGAGVPAHAHATRHAPARGGLRRALARRRSRRWCCCSDPTRSSPGSRSSSARWRSSPSAAPTRCSPTWRRPPSRPTAG